MAVALGGTPIAYTLSATALAPLPPRGGARLPSRAEDTQLPLTERLRNEAARRLAHDDELDAIERELRRDLHHLGSGLAWDTIRRDAPAPKPPLDATTVRPEVPFPELCAGADVTSGDQAQRRPSDHSDLDGFGEDHEEPGNSQRDVGALGDGVGCEKWSVQSQVPWILGDEKCSLTIFHNKGDALIRFHILKLETSETLDITCSDAYFDELCKEQSSLAGPAQVNAATNELFRLAMAEAADENLSGPGFSTAVKDGERRCSLDSFGEDDDEPVEQRGRLKRRASCSDEDIWSVQSQETWNIGKEDCILTIYQNSSQKQLRFEALVLSNAKTLALTCTEKQFSDVCDEQTGLFGPARVQAAVRQFFKEAVEELETDGQDIGLSFNSAPGQTELDEFGEDDTTKTPVRKDVGAGDGSADKWSVQSQAPYVLGKENCTLTIFHNSIDQLIRFEILKLDSADTMQITCSDPYFDELCKQHANLSGPAQVTAATDELFRLALEEAENERGLGAAASSTVQGGGLQNNVHAMGNNDDEDGFDDFGEDDDVAPSSQVGRLVKRRASNTAEDTWRVQSQENLNLGKEKCVLTTFTNKAQQEYRFQLLVLSTAKTLNITCSEKQFGDACDEQKGLVGPAKTQGAVQQLFKEAVVELHADGQDIGLSFDSLPSQTELDEFGEDDDFGTAKAPQKDTAVVSDASASIWSVQSQVPWTLGSESCTLSIFHNSKDALIRFEILKLESGETMSITCSDQYFDELCRKIGGCPGPAQVNAATHELFRLALAEAEKNPSSLTTDDAAQPDRGVVGMGNDDDGLLRRASVASSFGEDEDGADGREDLQVSGIVKRRASNSTDDCWRVQSQEAWDLCKQKCTLTIFQNSALGQLRFEALILSSAKRLCLTCTEKQFSDVCDEQKGLVGPARIQAGVRQLFQEAEDELQGAF